MNGLESTKSNNKIDNAIDWLKAESARQQFAEIGIRLIIHEGKIKRVQKEIIEKEQ